MKEKSDSIDGKFRFICNELNRYRAISSPSLNESSLENTNAKKSDVSPYTTTISVNGNNQNGVFYKFRKTFEHFKQCPPTSIHTSTSGTVTTATTINDNKNINNKYNNDNNIIGKNFTQKNLLEDKINIIPTIITATQGTTTNLLNNSNQLTTELNTNINNGGNSSNSSNGSFKNRFGASIWRNSQERRKTKFNRRDKCNSGDSGIQIEAENDENFIGNIGDDEDFEIDTNSIPNISVRRSNSARSTTITSNLSNGNCNVILSSESFRTPNKRNNMYYNNPQSGSASAKSKALKKVQNSENGSHKTSPKPKRSLSHPGLDQMTKYADDSDTDSISSHPDDKRPLFAEVLNQFTPAGPQELALEPGALVEIIRQDDGPWWYGKIKHDEIIEKILEPQQGWFPKDFVRLLNPFMQTSETENDFSQNQLNHKTSLTSVVEYNNTSVINCCDNNINSEDKNSSDSTITTTNTTTITNSNISSSQINSTFQELSQNNCNDNEKFIRDQLNIEQTSSLSSISSSSQQHQQQQQQHQDQQNSIISNSSSSQQSITLLEGNNFINNEQIIQNETNKINMESTSSSSCTINPFNIQHKNLVSNINENLRQNAIKELLETEINYVNLLSTLCLGYLKEMRKRIDIFSPDSLKIIFSNIEVVWEFQKTFLEALKKGVEKDSIAQTFINYQNGFSVYSTYCNSYPRALMELETYSSSKEAKCIFENIRVAQNLSHLPLSAHLLAPIQRICRYPLHLTEIVKHYPSKGGDIDINNEKLNKNDKNTNVNTGIIQSQLYNSGQSTIVCGNYCDNKENFEAALNVMKKVTENVNEGKRHSENLNRFQSSFENFQGPPIACHSTRFFMQTDATRISPNLWNNTYTLFLFDHQLIYCKKDILKRNHYMYKGRIFLDSCRILNLPDGKIFGVSLKNALRIYCETLNKWFDFCFRSSSRKLRFLSTLAIERQFCGTNLFVSELVGGNDPNEDDNLSDREYHSDYDTPTHNSETNLSSLNWKQNIFNNGSGGGNGGNNDQQIMIEKYYETLPKKSKKFKKHGISSTFGMNYQQYSNNSTAMNSNSHSNNNQNGSLGRRKIGSWFRKSKSTNTTPNQSPTHNPISNNPLTINTDNNLLHHTNSSPALDGGLLIETCKSVTNISTDAN
ncbi:putative uncharacterized protein DDB_G0282133 [Condylostylus longicornis]|uniref:putative uncharacterized protein DDB_G0282133 n=1 Tax=Condylostylus longicornis TaxID=2530218 RepID=UPI00244DAB21|nr:putative uncharacterized protein DDB_G0282133 [Condylostylus longicornis]